MILSNLDSIPGTKVQIHYGLVNGSTVRAKKAGKDFMGGFKKILWGELEGFTKLLEESRKESINRMKKQALNLGANAILNIRFSTPSVSVGVSEIFVYGTAVKLIKDSNSTNTDSTNLDSFDPASSNPFKED